MNIRQHPMAGVLQLLLDYWYHSLHLDPDYFNWDVNNPINSTKCFCYHFFVRVNVKQHFLDPSPRDISQIFVSVILESIFWQH